MRVEITQKHIDDAVNEKATPLVKNCVLARAIREATGNFNIVVGVSSIYEIYETELKNEVYLPESAIKIATLSSNEWSTVIPQIIEILGLETLCPEKS
jgi:hypothetical protein